MYMREWSVSYCFAPEKDKAAAKNEVGRCR